MEKYDLLYGGGYAIKDYYMESGNPRQMRGASELLIECTDEIEQLLMENYNVEAKDIIKSGATLYAKVPRDMSGEIVEKAELVFLTKCRTASAAFVAVPYEGEYTTIKGTAHAAYEKRRAAKFTDWDVQNAEAGAEETMDGYRRVYPKDPKDAVDAKAPIRCPRCRLRDTLYCRDNQYLCTSCAKRLNKSDERKYKMRRAVGQEFDNDRDDISDMRDLADGDGRVALLYADINDLGGQTPRETFDKDKKFHQDVDDAVKDAVHTAIRKAMAAGYRRSKDGTLIARFEIISLAGDDICLLLPGDVALLTAKTITDVFAGHDLGLTISVAVCVANDTTAVSYMEKIVNRALSQAKKLALKNKHNGIKQSVVNLSFFEKPVGLFPMTTDQLDRFTGLLEKSTPVATSALRNITEARRELVIDEEFDLYFNYCLSRDVKSEIKPILLPMRTYIQKNYCGPEPWVAWSDFVTWRRQKLGGDKR